MTWYTNITFTILDIIHCPVLCCLYIPCRCCCWCPEAEIRFFYCAQLSRFHLKTETEPSPETSCFKRKTERWNCDSYIVYGIRPLYISFVYLSSIQPFSAVLLSQYVNRRVFQCKYRAVSGHSVCTFAIRCSGSITPKNRTITKGLGRKVVIGTKTRVRQRKLTIRQRKKS
jgi:hypothetical protein